jgi:hypothetical protein
MNSHRMRTGEGVKPVVCDAGTRYVQMSVCALCGALESGWYREHIFVPSLLPETAEERDFFRCAGHGTGVTKPLPGGIARRRDSRIQREKEKP